MLMKQKTNPVDRIKTHVKEIDKALYGGIPTGSIVLLSGEAGAMKTTLAFHTIYNNALLKKKSIYV